MSDEKLIDEIAGTIWHKRSNCLDNCKPIAKEIIELVRDSEWISVDDELPDNEDQIQGYCDGEFTKVYLGRVCFCDNKWIVFDDAMDLFQVTHWKPISPPKQE